MHWPSLAFLTPARKLALGQALVALLALYLIGLWFIWWAMHRPPEQFGRIMARMPGPVPFLLYPFETLWSRARGGSLQVGELAPDFTLLRQDKTGTVQLSSLAAHQPVVLVFGSYT